MKKDDLYYANYKLLIKCNVESWNLLLKDNIQKSQFNPDNYMDNNDYIDDNEEKFICSNKNEYEN